MSRNVGLLSEAPSIAACTISRDVQKFDLLIEDMQNVAADRWGDLGFNEALTFLDQPDAEHLDFVVVAIDESDEGDLEPVVAIIAAARAKGVRVILVAEDVSPAALHQLLREGADEFIPYPLPEGELLRAVSSPKRGRGSKPSAAADTPAEAPAGGGHSGVVIPVYAMAGGAGGTTLAVNLAWELATLDKDLSPKVCLIDLGLQFGSVATFLDLPRREAVQEMLADTGALDGDVLDGALQTYNDRLHVLTAPLDLVPMDLVSPADVARLIETARVNFDYVVIDTPPVMADWSEAVLNAAHICFAVIGLDMRSAQNTLRIKRALAAEGLPFHKFRFALNRAPGFADLSGRSRVKRMAESLGISIELQFPDGGRVAAEAADQGLPLAEAAPKNALRREIAKLAKSIHEINLAEAAPQKVRARA
ncbi:AAA family ATPase [Rubellimicrobium roseum]|uniref:Pilus assembly protein CpaE n=1 Tax=Rubellimicrobium roseum TaxID=687525 RepID=A0A5C4NDN4_9RHOB|nr:AAA family ATPase [Rubellimicrobium roseum]TNC70937.1 pilus assembly protein CpaE [Rubellimicrobium roseum]